MVFDRKSLVIPDETRFEERRIVTKGDVVIGDRTMLQFGVSTLGRIFIGEHAIVDGRLDASDDIRIDIFSNIGGDVVSGGNTYLGEKVRVKGKLSLAGDLDVGDSVEIENGFEAKGWINIRSPIPMVIYIFIYLIQLLKLGHSEEIQRILEELEDNEGETIPISESFLYLPNNSLLGLTKSKVDHNLRIGKNCNILGSFEIKGHIFIDEESTIHGSLAATQDVHCGNKVKIHGGVYTNGAVHIGENTHIFGDIKADQIMMDKTATVDGSLHAKNGTSFIDKTKKQITEKVTRFEQDTDVVDEVKKMLE